MLGSDRVIPGVSTPGYPLNGLTQTETVKKIQQQFQTTIADAPIIYVLYQDKRHAILPSDIDLSINAESMAKQAVDIGRNGSFFANLANQFTAVTKGIRLPYSFQYNEEKLNSILTAIYTENLQKPQNAYCLIKNDQIEIQPEVAGQTPDLAKLLADCAREKLCAAAPLTVRLDIAVEMPAVTTTDLEEINALLGEYSSHYNAAHQNRSENIRIAADSLNQLLILPGQTVSFNDLVGLRVAEAGFKEAPVLVDGKSVPDIGGGVCQVSSTLYNAVLLADLKPLSRTPHFHPLGYVPIGFDATVADHLIDFVFQNTLPHKIYLLTFVDAGKITIFVLGNQKDKATATITLDSTIDQVLQPKTVERPDPALAPGTRKVEDGQEGYIVSSYRIKSQNGREISRELLYVDTYNAEDTIVHVGVKKQQ